MPPRTRPLTVVVGADTKPFQKGMKDADRTLDKFGKNASTRSKAASAGFKGIGIAATASVAGVGALAVAGKRFVDAYAEAEKSDARMQAQLKASSISYAAHAKQIDAVIQKTSRLAAVDDEDLQDAFTNIVRVTGNVNQSLKLTGVAADFAAAKQINVAKAGELLGKVAGGNVGILARYGFQVDKGTTATEALGLIQQKFAGQAKAFGDTNAGASARLSVAWENLQEKIGSKLAPALTKATNSAAKFIGEMESGTGAGGRFVAKLDEIRKEVEPVARQFLSAARSVARFAQAHPDLVRLAVGVAAVGTAIKAIRFAGAISGFSAFLSAGKTAATGLVKVMRGAGARAGEAAAANAAEGMANQMPKSIGARKGKFAMAGRIGGAAMSVGLVAGAAGAGVLIGQEVTSGLSKYLNDKLPEPLKKVSNIGKWIAGQLPQTKPFIKPDSRAGGGRIPGAPVAADTYPALLSPQEFVVTGDGERQLEAMTFPGVLDMLEGSQAPHFQNGGRAPRRMVSGGRVAQVASQAGFRGSALARMIAIAYRESRFNEKAQNLKYPDHSIGLWQINQLAHKGRYGSDAALMDPLTNAKAAWRISGQGKNFNPWSTNAGLSASALALGKRLASGVRGGSSGSSGSTSSGGSSSYERTPLRGGADMIFAGFQAATQGESLRQFLSAALENVGVRSSGGGATASTASSPSGSRRSGSSGSFSPGGGWGGTENLVMQATKGYRGTYKRPANHPLSISNPGSDHNMAIRNAFAADLPPGDSVFNTIKERIGIPAQKGSWNNFANKPVSGYRSQLLWYAPDGSHRDHVHLGIRKLRRGGRVARFQGGGRRHRYATGRPSGAVRSVNRGRTGANVSIAPFLNTISTGSPTSVQAALRKVQTFAAANGSVSRLRAWIAAANRRRNAKGVSATARQGLQSLVTQILEPELGRQLANPLASGDAAVEAFDQQTTDLGNEYAANRAGDAATAGAQGALATQQLQTLYASRATIATQLTRARRSGSKKTVQALEGRLSQADSAIKAKRAEVVGYQDQYTAATTPEAGSVDDTQQQLIDALRDMTARLTDVGDQLKRQTDVAIASSQTQGGQLTRALLDIVAGGLGDRAIGRGRTAGTGAIAVNY